MSRSRGSHEAQRTVAELLAQHGGKVDGTSSRRHRRRRDEADDADGAAGEPDVTTTAPQAIIDRIRAETGETGKEHGGRNGRSHHAGTVDAGDHSDYGGHGGHAAGNGAAVKPADDAGGVSGYTPVQPRPAASPTPPPAEPPAEPVAELGAQPTSRVHPTAFRKAPQPPQHPQQPQPGGVGQQAPHHAPRPYPQQAPQPYPAEQHPFDAAVGYDHGGQRPAGPDDSWFVDGTTAASLRPRDGRLRDADTDELEAVNGAAYGQPDGHASAGYGSGYVTSDDPAETAAWFGEPGYEDWSYDEHDGYPPHDDAVSCDPSYGDLDGMDPAGQERYGSDLTAGPDSDPDGYLDDWGPDYREGYQEDYAEEEYPEEEYAEDGQGEPDTSPVRQWLAMAGQLALGVLGGAGVWLSFNWLWMRVPAAALIAALAVIVGLVWLVRKIRRAEDIQTSVLAVLVGLVVTVSPAAMLLFSG
ncbi:hypothetical protein [Haloechinothrix sp. LS1_15]|uniref:hypothetical protein n=1 Tax=Haloechinothrix sp. LS1_15 TaxID=2652248 RepID=UPI002948AFE3|nr:hypothetical protein [Haloechinothrix sp. LS1_15]MDV6012617.1 hypothetical protein [Haloechinothrix sp. LS1_15]